MECTCTVYGIANCDAVKRTRAWMISHGQAHFFHDLRRHGVPLELLDKWTAAFGWEALVNRRGTTWRKLVESGVALPEDAATMLDAVLAHPSLLKRPVVVWPDGETTIGFRSEVFQRKLHSLNMAEPLIDWLPGSRLPASATSPTTAPAREAA